MAANFLNSIFFGCRHNSSTTTADMPTADTAESRLSGNIVHHWKSRGHCLQLQANGSFGSPNSGTIRGTGFLGRQNSSWHEQQSSPIFLAPPLSYQYGSTPSADCEKRFPPLTYADLAPAKERCQKKKYHIEDVSHCIFFNWMNILSFHTCTSYRW